MAIPMHRTFMLAMRAEKPVARIRRTLRHTAILAAMLTAHWGCAFALGTDVGNPAPVDFSRDIRPILSDRCFHCHGPDEKQRRGGFRLDDEKSALGVAESGAHPIVAGSAETSELIKRITTADASERMPPPDSSKTLSSHEIELLTRWIREGAKWQQHWAFVAPEQPKLPPIHDPKSEIVNAIDVLVAARLQAEKLSMSAEADKATLIRRVSFDLTGLPPTLAEIDAFVADESADAYEKVVDRLLSSPHYGEHMAVGWLDGARYADTNGFQNDFARTMWPWRDWVIKAYNDNMPYDQFIVEQIAGDMLPNATSSQRVATGLLRNNRTVTEAGSIEEEWHLENMVERVETTSIVFLGLTMGCARCHDHKYDPIRQREFYRFLGFFNSTKDRGFYNEIQGNTGPTEQLMSPEQTRRISEFDAAIARAEDDIRAAASDRPAKYSAWASELRARPIPQALPDAIVQLPLNGDLKLISGSSGTTETAPPSATYGDGEPNWAEGLPGKVLKLVGKEASHVDLGQAVQPQREDKFSIACWIRPQGAGAIWSKMDDAAGYRGIDALVFDDGKVEVHLVHQAPGNMIKVTANVQKLRIGKWNHICVTYDGSSKAEGLKIYFDGKPVPVEVNANSLTETIATDQPLRLGRRSASLFLNGDLSELGIYKQTLADAEISQLVESTLVRAVNHSEPPPAESQQALADFYEAVYSDAADHKARLAQLRAEKDAFLKAAAIPTVMVLEEMDQPRPTYLYKRGSYDAPDKSETLEPGVPAFLPPLPSDAPRNRLGLARWLTDPANPLVARVEANRLWQQFFGIGLVATTDNFGFQGDPPTNQPLLDYLALKLVRFNWDIKALQKEIVLSATYRQSSHKSRVLIERDPENQLLARGPRYRLSAEAIRDNALAVSGLLSSRIGGPSVKPYQPAGLWSELAGGAGEGPYKQDSGENLHRRSLYTYRKRTVPHPTTSTFDAPTWEICTARRSRTNTPLQALALLNDETYVEAGRALGQRMLLEGGDDVESRLIYGFRLVTGRRPDAKELALLETAHKRYAEQFAGDPAAADALVAVGEFKAEDNVKPGELAVYATLGSILLNLDETITNH